MSKMNKLTVAALAGMLGAGAGAPAFAGGEHMDSAWNSHDRVVKYTAYCYGRMECNSCATKNSCNGKNSCVGKNSCNGAGYDKSKHDGKRSNRY